MFSIPLKEGDMREIFIDKANYHDPALLCPYCGEAATHHDRVEIYDRNEDAATGLHVVVDGEQLTADHNLTGNPSSRRHGLRVWFWCECCGGRRFALTITQHKGVSHFILEPSNDVVSDECWGSR
jgi:hypothetical protein